MYEFPLIEHATEAEWQEYHESKSKMQNAKCKILSPITHILSHQRLHARFFVVPVDKLPAIPDTIAVAWQALDDYALSRLTLKALEGVFR